MSEIIKSFFDKKTDKFCQIYENPNLIDRIFRKSVIARSQQVFSECLAMGYKSILDIGCGSGLLALKLAQADMDVVGIDFSKEMINKAKQACQGEAIKGKLEFWETDLMDFNPNCRFDAIIALGFFDYVSNPKKYLEKITSLASKEVIISFPAAEDLLSLQRKIRYRLFKRCPVYFYKRKQIELLVAESVFSDFNLIRLYRDYLLRGYLK